MDDLISRRLAIDTLAKEIPVLTTPDGTGQFDHDIHVTDEAYVDCMQIINELPSAQQWIPCSERLPVDDDYRESMECLDGCVWYFTDKGAMGLGYYYYSTKAWSTLRDLKPDGKVIAWMPLPEPYKDGEQHG